MAPASSLRLSLPRAPTPANSSRRLAEKKLLAFGGATMVSTRSMEPRICLIAGPTASGKSALALRLGEPPWAGKSSTPTLHAAFLYADLRLP